MSGGPAAPDLRQVGLVLLARWRMGVRGARSSPGRIVATLVGVALQAALVAFLTAAAGFAMRHLVVHEGPEIADAAVHAGFLLTFLWLATSPPLGLRGNEFLDVTKLFTLPVSPRTVLGATLCGLATTTSVLVLVLPLGCAVLVRARGAADAAAGLAAVVVVAALGIVSGQTLLLLFLGVFRSRRWRDLSVVILAILSGGLFLVFRLGFLEGGTTAWRPALEAFAGWKDRLLVLPSWWGAHAATATGGPRVLPLLAAVPVGVLLFRAASALVERAFHGEVEEPSQVSRGARRGFAGTVARLLPDPLAALVEKDLRILGRDPSMRLQVVHHLALVGVPVVAVVLRGTFEDDGEGAARAIPWFLAAGFFFASTPLYLNPLGSEGAGIAHAFASPVPRGRWLLAKALSLVVVLGGTGAAGVLVLGTALGATLGGLDPARAAGSSVLAAFEGVVAAAVAAGVGAIVGVVAPSGIVTRDRRALRQTSAGRKGCLRALLGMAGAGVVLAALLPAVLAMHLPDLLGRGPASAAWTATAVPFALAWGGLVLLAGTWIGGRIAERREEDLLADLCRSES